ncbi:hypothetical protein ACIPWI_19515 [Streptomyces sp. NPDC090046]|uniref:hypothetical protein n=1 Tax=Streptomyces sp. NPDC090046 TaxID=3365928 RepID=UPI003816729B
MSSSSPGRVRVAQRAQGGARRLGGGEAVAAQYVEVPLLERGQPAPDKGRQIGYWLHPAATALALALVEQAFRHQGVEGVHDPANLASGAVVARLGMTERLAPAQTGDDQIWWITRGQAVEPAPTPGPGSAR